MRSLIHRLFRWQGSPAWGLFRPSLFLGLLLVGVGLALFVTLSWASTRLTAGQLQLHWRTSYDLLVRPPDAPTDMERERGLVRANYLSGLYGGISVAQYHAIRDLAEVEVAAPIAMVGFMDTRPSSPMGSLEEKGTYRYTRSITATDGIHEYLSRQEWYAWIEPLRVYEEDGVVVIGAQTYDEIKERKDWQEQQARRVQLEEAGLRLDPSGSHMAYCTWGEHWLFLLAGIDPEQEARLVDFGRAITAGRLLNAEDRVELKGGRVEFLSPSGDIEEVRPGLHVVPLLINSHIYAQASAECVVDLLAAPKDDTVITNTLRQGRSYLEALPVANRVWQQETTLDETYQWLFDALQKRGLGGVHAPPPSALKQPAPVEYRLVYPSWPSSAAGVAEAIPVDTAADGQVLFRPATVLPYRYGGAYKVVGAFDIAGLRDPYAAELNALPMDIYRPPLVTLRYDEAGRPVEPVQMIPTLNPQGYVQMPPYALTTIEGAQVFAGDNCISAIRVRVQGVEMLNVESWQRIQAVAQKIRDLTGLRVDTTLGSSPTPLLVHLPGTGYVEEPWIKTGVAIAVQRGLNQADLVLFGSMFLVFWLYILGLSSVSILSRQQEIGLLAALGWRQSTIFASLLSEAVLLALGAGLLGALLTWGSAALLKLDMPVGRLGLAFPVGLILHLLGGLWPAWRAARQAPVIGVQLGELRPRQIRWGRFTAFTYGLRNLFRKPGRMILSLLELAVSTALAVLFLLVSLEAGGLLRGTVLGQDIAVRIQPYHYALATACLAVATLTLAHVVLLNVSARQREVGMLQTVGWRADDVLRGFMLEGGLVGALGGLLGCLVGSVTLWSIYRVVPTALAWVGPLGLALATALSALASWLAARGAVGTDSNALKRFRKPS